MTVNEPVLVTLDQPFVRGDGKAITTIKLQAPRAIDFNAIGGRLGILQMLDNAHASIIERVSQPQVTKKMYASQRPSTLEPLMTAVMELITPDESLTEEVDDGFVVTLSQPLTIKNTDGEEETLTTLKINDALTVRHIDSAGGRAVLYQMLDKAHAKVLSQITEPALTPQHYNRLHVRDSQALMNVVIYFLDNSSNVDNYKR